MKEVKKMVCKGGGAMMPYRPIDLWTIWDHLARYAFAAGFIRDKVVLDVACGSGYGSAYLFDKGARMVVGGDISLDAIRAAKKFYQKPGVEFLLSDATRLPFADNSFDTIVSMETIEHLAQYRDYLRECQRVLKQEGTFICSTPHKWHDLPVTYGPYHVHEFRLDEFRELIQLYFPSVELYAQGYFTEAEKTKLRIALQKKGIVPKVSNLIQFIASYTTPKVYYFATKVYYFARFLYTRITLRQPSMQLNEITDWDKILTQLELSEMWEEHKITCIGNSCLTPRTIIAVAKK